MKKEREKDNTLKGQTQHVEIANSTRCVFGVDQMLGKTRLREQLGEYEKDSLTVRFFA